MPSLLHRIVCPSWTSRMCPGTPQRLLCLKHVPCLNFHGLSRHRPLAGAGSVRHEHNGNGSDIPRALRGASSRACGPAGGAGTWAVRKHVAGAAVSGLPSGGCMWVTVISVCVIDRSGTLYSLVCAFFAVHAARVIGGGTEATRGRLHTSSAFRGILVQLGAIELRRAPLRRTVFLVFLAYVARLTRVSEHRD